jgi:D-3-phosphoglycerate dehydrogenase
VERAITQTGADDILDPDAAPAASESERSASAGRLDVFDPEPTLHHPLSDHPDRNLRKATA